MNRQAAALALFTIVFWSSSYTAIRIGLEDFSPGPLAFLRFAVASAALLLLAPVLGVKRPERQDMGLILLAGFLGIALYHTALNYGETRVPAGTAALLIAFAPAFTATLAHFLLGERLRPLQWVGVALGLLGVGLITWGSGDWGWRWSALAIVGAALSTSLFFIVEKVLFRRYSPAAVTVYASAAGLLFLLPFAPGAWRELSSATPEGIGAAIYLGVFPGALAYLTWNRALQLSATGSVTSFLYLAPVVAMGVAHRVLGEIPSALSALGGGVVLAGVILASQRPSPQGARVCLPERGAPGR
ncbi:MAG: EamA family transporter [Clostridiales bacterium]|nr:EamA family transporter [Clostridiales bacterium]